jgi:hypothetical protein
MPDDQISATIVADDVYGVSYPERAVIWVGPYCFEAAESADWRAVLRRAGMSGGTILIPEGGTPGDAWCEADLRLARMVICSCGDHHLDPGWRDLPVIERPPHNHGGAAHAKALAGWRKRWEPLLPAGWLEWGGPIRTQRAQPATRHVPGGTPGGGYDMSAGPGAPEHPSGQLGLF